MSVALYSLVDQFKQLERLADDDIPEEVLRDTLEGLAGEIELKSLNVVKYAANLLMVRDAVLAACAQMKARADRLTKRAESLHEYVRGAMEAAGIKKVECPEFTVSIVNNPPAVVVDDEAKVPATFKVTPPPEPPPTPRVDKKAVAEALKAYVRDVDAIKAVDASAPIPPSPVPGAHLEFGTRLKVRV